MTVSQPNLEQVRAMTVASLGLTDTQLAKYTELLPEMLTTEAYTDPVVFAYQVTVASELAVWMTSPEFYRLRAAS
jgi:hypothetical protein